jgi:hypothetical protein
MSADRNVGLGRFAQGLVAATALAPVLIVWAAAAPASRHADAIGATVVAVLMVVVCVGVLRLGRSELQRQPLVVNKVTRLDKEALAFLVTYALPLVSSGSGSTISGLGLFAFVVLVGIVLVQLQILHVNPLLGLLGFHFYEIERVDGDTALVISRSREAPRGTIQAHRLAPTLWLIAQEAK